MIMSTIDNNQEFIVRYRNEVYDINKFLHKHPGGVNTLKGLQNSDMTERFMKAPPHSDAALYLMKEYKRKDLRLPNGINGHKKRIKQTLDENCNGNGHIKYDSDTVDAKDHIKTDESMEHLVDWSKPMLAQIPNLGEHYTDWVNKPVDRPLRLFGPWYLEMLTKTPWWIVPTFWIPVISYIIITEDVTASTKIFKVLGGIFLWTIIEYSLHRWVFHVDTNHTKAWLCTFHFVIHGLHHKVPFDPYRLVFPPLPAVLIAAILYTPIYILFDNPRLLLAGGLIGYLAYDMIHYYLHYGSPGLGHLYQMKRYHYQHHFVRHDLGYGISSPVWDFAFGTAIHLRKLKYVLKW